MIVTWLTPPPVKGIDGAQLRVAGQRLKEKVAAQLAATTSQEGGGEEAGSCGTISEIDSQKGDIQYSP